MSELDEVFAAVAAYFGVMAEPTRLRIVHALCREERSVNQIAEELQATQTNVSRHLGHMHRSGVVSRRKAGNQVFYRISDSTMIEICRTVCTQIAARIDERRPLRKGLLKVIPDLRKAVA